MNNIIYLLDLTGTAVFAVSGALAAGRKKMDFFGVLVLGCVTALGGGTLRDLMLGIGPVFWISDSIYLLTALTFASFTFVLARRRKIPRLSLMYADAAGLAVFTVIGFQIGFNHTGNYGISVVMGVSTGVAGGIIRDVLSSEIPLIFRKEIYASASFCGAGLLAALYYFNFSRPGALAVSVLAVLIIRTAALKWNLRLPLLRLKEEDGKET